MNSQAYKSLKRVGGAELVSVDQLIRSKEEAEFAIGEAHERICRSVGRELSKRQAFRQEKLISGDVQIRQEFYTFTPGELEHFSQIVREETRIADVHTLQRLKECEETLQWFHDRRSPIHAFYRLNASQDAFVAMCEQLDRIKELLK